MTKYNLRALAVLCLAGLLILVVQLGAGVGLVPSWQVLLTEPLSSFHDDSESPTEEPEPDPVPVDAVPELPPLQLANRPAAEAPPPEPSEPEPVANEPPETEALETILAAVDSLRHRLTAEPDTLPAPAEIVPPEITFTELICRGGDLVEEGLDIPQLQANWTPALLAGLVRGNYGDIVAEHAGRHYRLVLDGRSTLRDAQVVALTESRRARLSNRGVELNRRRLGGRWIDTPLRPAFTAQERLVLALTGDCPEDCVPVFTFYASAAFDRYLATKQLGTFATAREAYADAAASPAAAATDGRIVLTPDGPVYLIDLVILGGDSYPWRDPEADLIRM